MVKNMVDIPGGVDGPIEHRFNNAIFIGPAIIVIVLISFFAYKLIQRIRERERSKEEKKKQKMKQKRESSNTAKKRR